MVGPQARRRLRGMFVGILRGGVSTEKEEGEGEGGTYSIYIR